MSPSPRPDGPFLRAGVRFHTSKIVGFGSGTNRYRRFGIIDNRLHVLENTGMDGAMELVDVLVDIFQTKKVNGIRFWDTALTDVAKLRNWYTLRIVTDITFDDIR